MITENKDLKFGANYVPSKDWFFSWENFNEKNVDEDLCAIASLGVDHIRMHVMWSMFQPNQTYVPERMLERLVCVLDLAQKHGLKAELTVFDGWMSGFWFLPPFAYKGSIITDKEQIRNEFYFLEKLAGAVANHPALMGIDLGNEINMFGYAIKPFSTAEGDEWMEQIFAKVNELFAGKINVLGVDHQPWYDDCWFSRKKLTSLGTLTSVHSWTAFTGALRYNGALGTESLTLQEFNVELANAYATDVDRKVWVEEFGISPYWAKEEEFEPFVRLSLINAMRSDNLFGWTFWCSHNVSRKFEFDKLEYDLGLFDNDNNLKPLGKIYKDCISLIKKGAMPAPKACGKALILTDKNQFDADLLTRSFAKASDEGEHLKFVLEEKINDEKYLAKRGITELITEIE